MFVRFGQLVLESQAVEASRNVVMYSRCLPIEASAGYISFLSRLRKQKSVSTRSAPGSVFPLTLRHVRPNSFDKLGLHFLRFLPLRARTCVRTSSRYLSFPIGAQWHKRSFASWPWVVCEILFSRSTRCSISQIAWCRVVKSFGWTSRCPRCGCDHPIGYCYATFRWFSNIASALCMS